MDTPAAIEDVDMETGSRKVRGYASHCLRQLVQFHVMGVLGPGPSFLSAHLFELPFDDGGLV